MGSIDRILKRLKGSQDTLIEETQNFIDKYRLEGEVAVELIGLVQNSYVNALQVSFAEARVVKFNTQELYSRFEEMKNQYR